MEKNTIFWEVKLCGSCRNRRFGGTYNLQLVITANAVPSLLIPFTLEAILSCGISVLIVATWHHITEDGILHSHRRENFKYYISITGWAL
jgi:hypothetical protein